MSVGPTEVAVVVILLVLLFGAKRVPEAGRALGTSLREFKEGLTQAKEPIELAREFAGAGERACGGPMATGSRARTRQL